MVNFHFTLPVYVFAFLMSYVIGDIYLHNPRGSNNRLDEENRDRRNAKRMFDSQNNNRGGYNAGSVFYYAGSTLQIEWTNQHSCKNPNSHCELIVQYMCDNSVRDGASIKTIPFDNNQCANFNCNTDKEYGMNENYQHYLSCKTRERNKGLFTADQNLNNRNRAINTRQNPNGQRYAYECPEEKDYYPYWQSSPWKDIVVMTNDVTRCMYYQKESQNVKSRWGCVIPEETLEQIKNDGRYIVPNNKAACEAFRYPKGDEDGVKGVWTEFPAHNIAAPECRETEFSRDNHLGNGVGLNPNVYNWTVPNLNSEHCVLRMRYNISTEDYDGWNTTVAQNNLDLSKKYGFPNQDAAEDRGYEFQNNPDVKVFGDADFVLELAINTAQYGRTFQDRSFSFAVRPPPENLEGAVIHNLNVRGKRGNIVQVYPAVEYDYVPNQLQVGLGDYVHIQWTGSNTNNPNNDGNGQARTDRNNLLVLASQNYPEGNGVAYNPGPKYGHYGNNYPMNLNNVTFLGLSRTDIESLAIMSPGHFGGEISQLDDAGTYFNLEPRKVTKTGTYHFMCTRNNDFSNRDQKGKIEAYEYPIKFQALGWMGGNFSLPNDAAVVEVEQGDFTELHKLRLEKWTPQQATQVSNMIGDEYASDFVALYPETELTTEGKTITMKIKLNTDKDVSIYRSTTDNLHSWVEMDAEVNNGVASFQTSHGGVYVATTSSNIAFIVGIVVGCVVIAIIVIATVVYFKRNPGKWQKMKNKMHYAERSMQDKV